MESEEDFRDRIISSLCEGGFSSISFFVNSLPVEELEKVYDFLDEEEDEDEDYGELLNFPNLKP